MRRKQIGPELKLLELDTLKYITPDNIKDSIYYIGIYPERMSPADVTFARKSGLLYSTSNALQLSKLAIHYILGAISFSEYSFLMLTKQWIKTIDVKNEPTIYNEPLLPFVLKEIYSRGHIQKSTFTQEIDKILINKYTPIKLSNINSMRYIIGLLKASKLVIIVGGDYAINPIATAVVCDIINNRSKFKPPTCESEFESFWNSMEHGIFDILHPENVKTYSSLYPNLISCYEKKI